MKAILVNGLALSDILIDRRFLPRSRMSALMVAATGANSEAPALQRHAGAAGHIDREFPRTAIFLPVTRIDLPQHERMQVTFLPREWRLANRYREVWRFHRRSVRVNQR